MIKPIPINEEIELDPKRYIVSETDARGKITYVNDYFMEISGYLEDELIGQPHSVIRHPDMPKVAFKSLWDTIQKGEIWTGYVKNATKSGGYYWVYATVYPFETCDGSKGYLSCRRKPSRAEIDEHDALYKEWKRAE